MVVMVAALEPSRWGEGMDARASSRRARLRARGGARARRALDGSSQTARMLVSEARRKQREQAIASSIHDLSGTLTRILLHLDILAESVEADDSVPPPIADGLQAVGRMALEMLSQMASLQDLSRLDHGLGLQRAPMDLVAAAYQMADDYQPLSPKHTIRVEPAISSLEAWWDRRLLDRVFANLLSNALKYSPDGGTIFVRLWREEHEDQTWALFHVRDEGVGIPAADLPHVFEPFRRGRNVADRMEGQGIGLASVRQIVSLHGGEVAAESREQEGTTITVRLPFTGPAD